ncbi:MAG: peroxiredoxin, partial [Pseudomonadota bacterium]|nr:peroxiredoxin [Pseudomonadota bacterium]
MAISVGDKLPSVTLYKMGSDGPEVVSTKDYCAGRKVVIFGVPGAFTPTCSAQHVPGFIQNADAIKAKGVDAIACVSVNDAFVMGAWAGDQGTGETIDMLADGN